MNTPTHAPAQNDPDAPAPELRTAELERPPRAPFRAAVAGILFALAIGLNLGVALRMPTFAGANDTSRWCTVWALLERGTYAIDECPWEKDTQDKVRLPDPRDPETLRFYSSKPAFLPTIAAGILYPFRAATGVPLDAVVKEVPRTPRPDRPGVVPEPLQWPAHVYYLKPVVLVFNVLPYAVFLVLFARFLDRRDVKDWTWAAALAAAALGTPLVAFNSSLNNHTVAAYFAFFALYALVRVLLDRSESPRHYAAAGFCAAMTAAAELPAVVFAALVVLALLVRNPRKALLWTIPAAAIPAAVFLAAQYAAIGRFTPAYSEFGRDAYKGYDDSYWTAPVEIDALDEPKPVYLLHMTVGHHGVLSLSPVLAFALAALLGALLRGPALARLVTALALGIVAFAAERLWMASAILDRGAEPPDWLARALAALPDPARAPLEANLAYIPLALVLLAGALALLATVRRDPERALAIVVAWPTIAMFAFYLWRTNNYGGWSQGMRWLFWLFPLWLAYLPAGIDRLARSRSGRAVFLVALALSAMTVGYAARNPWTHPWMLDWLEHLDVYVLTR